MGIQWKNKSGLAKAAAILATIFTISLGLCGAQLLVMSQTHVTQGPDMAMVGVVELIAMLLSFVGLVIVALLSIVKAIIVAQKGGPR